jgi:predicted transcriptional regulator
MPGSAILLSIKPRFVEMIFDGSKSVELRRVKPKYIGKGSLVLIYSSSPVKSIVGVFSVDFVVQDCVDRLWEMVKNKSGLTFREYNRYFDGAKIGSGIFINERWKLPNPVSLDSMREKDDSFNPPQNFMYAKENVFFNQNIDLVKP